MNQIVRPPLPSGEQGREEREPIRIGASACPHDCPSTCALEVEVLDERTIGRVRGAADNGYTAGVICAKVARYAERVHHPDRLTQPLVRKGAKGSGDFTPVSWDDALDLVAEKFLRIEQHSGPLRQGAPGGRHAPWKSTPTVAWPLCCMNSSTNTGAVLTVANVGALYHVATDAVVTALHEPA